MVVFQNIKHRITSLVIPLLGVYSQRIKAGTQTGICTPSS